MVLIYSGLLLAALYVGSYGQMGGMGGGQGMGGQGGMGQGGMGMGGMGGMGGGMGGMGMGGMGGGMGCKLDQKCFQFCPDYTLADAFPFVRQTPITCDKCQKLCNKLQGMGGQGPYQCASAVYDAQVGSCDIFAVSDQGMGRKKRDCGQPNCGGKRPHKQPYPGRIYLVPTGMCAGQGGNDSNAGGGGGGSGGGGGGPSGGATTVASTSAGATSAATTAVTSSSMKKKVRDQAFYRKDDVVGRCIATRNSMNVKDCSRGIRFVGTKRHQCTPTAQECRDT